MIPEETRPPWELRELEEPFEFGAAPALAMADGAEDFGLAQTVLDPRLNSIHVSLLHERQQVPIRMREHLITLCDQLLRHGPPALSPRDKRILLWDADSMLTLHRKLWSSPAAQWHQWWREAFDSYVQKLPAGGN